MAIFDWDAEKARVNLAKHGVSFEDASGVWSDPLRVIYPDQVIDHSNAGMPWALSEL